MRDAERANPTPTRVDRLAGLSLLAMAAVWLRLLYGAASPAGPKAGVWLPPWRGSLPQVFGPGSIYLDFGPLPLVLVATLVLTAGATSMSRHHRVALLVGGLALLHLAIWGGYGWYHHGSFNGTSGLNSVVDPPAYALAGSILSLIGGLVLAAIGLGRHWDTTTIIRPHRDPVVLLTTLHVVAVAIMLAAGAGQPILYLLALFTFPWTAMILAARSLRADGAIVVRAMVAVGPLAFLAAGSDRLAVVQPMSPSEIAVVVVGFLPFSAIALAEHLGWTGRAGSRVRSTTRDAADGRTRMPER